MGNRKILVIGSVNVDYALHVITFPAPGETAVGTNFSVAMGGKGANQAVACARLGGNVRFLACVGDDAGGERALESFSADGIDTDSVRVSPGQTTGAALIFVDSKGENCIGIASGANSSLSAELIRERAELIANADYLLLQLESPLEAVCRAAEIAHNSGCTVILNPAPASGPLPETLIRHVDIITPNQSEAETLTGVRVRGGEDARRSAAVLHDAGIETVVVTLGEEGALVSDRMGVQLCPGTPADVIDTVAAGDTFNGALVVGLSEGMSLADSVGFANSAAALSVARAGAQPSIPHRTELNRTQ